MKKVLLLTAIVLSSCSVNINSETESVVSSVETGENALEIDIWDVDPVYSYEDIDTSFVSLWHCGKKDYENQSITYMMKDPYNSLSTSAFDGSYEKGGIFIYKYGLYGVMNSEGKITVNPSFEKFTIPSAMMINESVVMGCRLQYDYQIDFCTDAWGIGGDYRDLGFMNKNEQIVDYDNKLINIYDLHKDAVDAGFLEEDDCFVFESKVRSGYEDFLEGFILVGKDYYKQITEKNDVKIICYSDNVILFAKMQFSENNTKPVFSDYEFYREDGSIIGSGFEKAYGFFDGYAPVKKDGKWGYINKDGECVTGYIFDKATPVCDGKAWVIYQGRTGRLNILDIIDNNIFFDEKTLTVSNYPLSDDNTKWIKICVDEINVRDNPSTSGKKISMMHKDDIVSYIQKEENEGYTWYMLNENRWIADKNGEWIREVE